jgi:hypothetical protein
LTNSSTLCVFGVAIERPGPGEVPWRDDGSNATDRTWIGRRFAEISKFYGCRR